MKEFISSLILWFIVLFVTAAFIYFGYNDFAPSFQLPVQRIDYGAAVAFVLLARGVRASFKSWKAEK